MTVTVVCGFADGHLPSSWFRLYQRLKVAVRRAGVDADVRLASLRRVTADAAIVVVPPDLEGQASEGGASGWRVVALHERDTAGLKALVESLSSMGAGPAPEGTALAYHRGFRLIATRVAGATPAASA